MTIRRTVFERAGGFARVNRVVMTFYEKMLDSPITSPYFADIDMRTLIDHQTKFIATVMGGPASYSNEQLERVHARHHISETAFMESLVFLREALEDNGLEPEDVQLVVDEFMSRKNFIVSRNA